MAQELLSLKKSKSDVYSLWRDHYGIGWMIGFSATFITIYCLLLGSYDTFLSLNFLLQYVDHLTSFVQFIVIGCVPVYLSCLIFGISLLGGWTGAQLWRKCLLFKRTYFDHFFG